MNIVERLKSKLNEETVDLSGRTLVIWGTGCTAGLYNEGLKRVEKDGINISYYTDSHSEKWGGTFNSRPVISPKEITELKNPLVLIASPHANYISEISQECDRLHIEARHIDDVLFRIYRDQVNECLELFDDDRSIDIYSEMVSCRMEGRRPNPMIVSGRSLFNIPEFMAADYDGNMIDCGAFVGDSIETYIQERESSYAAFGHITAFEPDDGNFEALKRRISRLKSEWCISDDKITLYKAGVGAQTKTNFLSHSENSIGSMMVDNETANTIKVQICAIDDIIKESYSFLKADIESYEYQMLFGAEKTIKKYKPNIAVCIYHSAFDMMHIPLLLHKMVPDYRMIVRQHNFHTSETLLYAWKDKV